MMGCDIHCFVEYRNPESKYWDAFGGEFRLTSNYDFFARLAGVRNYKGVDPIAAERYVPADCSCTTWDKYSLYIGPNYTGKQGSVSRENADKYVAEGRSVYLNGDKYISDPDWHSASTASPDEWGQVVSMTDCTDDYHVLLVWMRELERRGYEVRTVFWFDN